MGNKELYLNLVTNKIAIYEALALSLAFVPLSQKERLWIENELNGYSDKFIVPDYRKLPCEVKARIQNLYSGIVEDIVLTGKPMEDLEAMLNNKLGLSVYKMYLCQGVESMEQQVADHNDGDIIMIFDGPLSLELKSLLRPNERRIRGTGTFIHKIFPHISLNKSHRWAA